MSPRALGAGLLAGCLLAGCGGSSSSSSPASTSTSTARSSSSQGTEGRQLTLHETEFKITPAGPRVPSTGTITITVKNVGAVIHALVIQTPSGARSTGDIAPGATASLKVDLRKAGHYLMYCPIDSHRQLGMQGTLVVGSASSGSSGGVAAPSGGAAPGAAPGGGASRTATTESGSSTKSASGTPSTSSTSSSGASSSGSHPPSGGSGY